MIKYTAPIILIIIGILLFERRNLKDMKTAHRWLVYSMLAVGGAIWIYVYGSDRTVHPTRWLQMLLEPFDPIR
ncbi:hypothetical protein [Paenibacillus xerothermodurans]|uniref:Uncharacterized protein n=1 Tax=Paenibacillus xerothermodurans TaxID=1977292 RepID=A0A2W1NCJ8_PAEXE|nr:hypothetical protein [Paenibacillus xerothermodurans]PZE21380.1 hypothetical protein CBW46_008450 [Paenibacillus xerothermodurans]